MLCPLRIGRFIMLATVQFDDELARDAQEIDNMGPDRRLPPKLEPFQLAIAKRSPEYALYVRAIAP
jgi:hypothetical protein